MKWDNLITIMIPTLDRPVFIGRLLQYYADNKYKHKIIIGDSSKWLNAEINESNVELFKKELDVKYLRSLGYNDCETIRYMTALVDTPYAVFSGDDDLLVPSGLDKCVEFLEHNRGYSAVHGKGIIRDIVTGKESIYRQPIIEGKTGSRRILEYLSDKCHPVLFSVHPTSLWVRMYANIGCMTDKNFSEYLPCCISAINGKIAEIDCPYLIRQHHTARYKQLDLFDWMMKSEWNVVAKNFMNFLTEELSMTDVIGMDVADKVIKQAFWQYLAHGLNKKYKSKYCMTFKQRIKKAVGL